MFRENFTNSHRENSAKFRIVANLAEIKIYIWHARMRHLRYDNLIKLQNQIDEMNLIDQKSIEIFESCMIDRQKRNVNKIFRFSINKFLQIVHSDLRKSLSRTRSDHDYYIIFRNDWSNVIWMHLLRNKNQTFDAFKNFQINIERLVDDCKTIILKRDNANEYIDQKF